MEDLGKKKEKEKGFEKEEITKRKYIIFFKPVFPLNPSIPFTPNAFLNLYS